MKNVSMDTSIFDIFKEYFTQNELDLFLKENIIEICPFGIYSRSYI